MSNANQGERKARRFTSGKRQKLVLGGIAAASVSLSGCSSSEPEFSDARFTSVAECTKAGFPEDLCSQSYTAAMDAQRENAPKFDTLAACQQEWGANNCTPTYNASTGGNVFMPLLAGFMVGRLMQRDYWNNGYVNYYGGGYSGTPIYRNRSGGTVTVDRGSTGVARTTPVNVNTKAVASRGFGGMGMSRSGGGRSGGFSFGG
ncbi:hypothetical protein B2G71_02055 [Novosphingobium sp. PC22D]|uniref:DUF1190 domain-containing protein n=1 Tax=Novosphingobium sp. PC22D TaxID=1962403 RepID=UPI000BF13786|nr:DUF1190 domain-containing protein [Novosphingobium sp. PC22D]PEQ14403.1 hypothetical protein B2G71_02055 [Novosphingobium sp. PC22D]